LNNNEKEKKEFEKCQHIKNKEMTFAFFKKRG